MSEKNKCAPTNYKTKKIQKHIEYLLYLQQVVLILH